MTKKDKWKNFHWEPTGNYTTAEEEFGKIDISQYELIDVGAWFVKLVQGKYLLSVNGNGHFGTGGMDDVEITKEDVEFLRENKDKIKVIMRKYGYY